MIFNKKFFFFNVLNLIDKFLIFLLPLLPLILFEDQLLYNEIELIYSVCLIIYIFTDGGIKNYSLSFYRNSNDKKNFLISNIKYINTLSIYYLCIFFPLIGFFIYFTDANFIYLFILFRILLLINSNYFKVHFSLNNKQQYMLVLTLLISIFTLAYVFLRFFLTGSFSIFDFFIFQILIMFVLIIYNFINKNFLSINKLFNIFKKSISFSFPLILNALIFLIIMHFIKIYSYNYLSSDEMTEISFILRFMLIIQIFHGGFTNYFFKNFFETKVRKIDIKIFSYYILILIIVSFLVMISFPFVISLLNLNFSINLVFFLIFGYTIIWCIAAFFEQYLNKFYKNKYILLYSIISLFFYILILNFFKHEMFVRMCLAMIISVSVYFVLIMLKVKSVLNEK